MSMSSTPSREASRRSFRGRGSSKRSGGGGDDGGVVSRGRDRRLDFARYRSSSSVANNNSQAVNRYLKRLSGLVADPIELDLDQRRLQNAVREAGEHSFGVAAISVWIVNEDDGKLFMPAGGWWRSPEMEEADKNVALARLEDCTRDDYVPPKPVSPGTDIAGILWTESKGGTLAISQKRSSLGLDSGESSRSLGQPQAQETSGTNVSYQPIRWRDIQSITRDPDSATGPRLKLMEEAGFTSAAGVIFLYQHHKGMVMFLTTEKDKNDNRLTCVANGAYLNQAAQYIGATLSFSEIRRASLAEQHKLQDQCYSMREYKDNSARETPEASVEEGKGGSSLGQTRGDKENLANTHQLRHHLPPHFVAWLRKMKGGSMQAPPSLSWTQTLWTIFGCFIGLLVLSSLNEYYRMISDDEFYLIIGPFGALCTLMYGLSAAPASQPRNAVLGQAVAGAVSLGFTYIPEAVLPVWLRLAVGPAFAIGTMVKLGLIHPPAGAHSVLYATGKYNFGLYALVVLSTAISVIPATCVNNMSAKRQYPTYWGVSDLGPRLGLAFSRFKQLVGLHGDGKQGNGECNNTQDLTTTQVTNEIVVQSDGRTVKESRLDQLAMLEEEDEKNENEDVVA